MAFLALFLQMRKMRLLEVQLVALKNECVFFKAGRRSGLVLLHGECSFRLREFAFPSCTPFLHQHPAQDPGLSPRTLQGAEQNTCHEDCGKEGGGFRSLGEPPPPPGCPSEDTATCPAPGLASGDLPVAPRSSARASPRSPRPLSRLLLNSAAFEDDAVRVPKAPLSVRPE